MKKILLLTILAIFSIGVMSVNINAAELKRSPEMSSLNSEDTAAVTQAMKFINAYYPIQDELMEKGFDEWAKKIGTTNKFREEFKKYLKYLEISTQLFESKDNKEKTKLEQALKYLENYKFEYDPIFGINIQDLSEEKTFKLKLYDKEKGIVILENNKELTGYPKVIINGKEHSINIAVSVRVVKENGKWLVDGAGFVNLKQRGENDQI